MLDFAFLRCAYRTSSFRTIIRLDNGFYVLYNVTEIKQAKIIDFYIIYNLKKGKPI